MTCRTGREVDVTTQMQRNSTFLNCFEDGHAALMVAATL